MTDVADAREDLEAGTGSSTAAPAHRRRERPAPDRRVDDRRRRRRAARRPRRPRRDGALQPRPAVLRAASSRREPRDGVAGYALDPAAVPMLERGDARIFGERAAPAPTAGAWSRSRSRSASAAAGTSCGDAWRLSAAEPSPTDCGSRPPRLEDELRAAARGARRVTADVTLFAGASACAATSARRLARWYDLPRIRPRPRGVPRPLTAGRGAPGRRPRGLRAVDRARSTSGASSRTCDPGLPADGAPRRTGRAPPAAALFARLRDDRRYARSPHAAARRRVDGPVVGSRHATLSDRPPVESTHPHPAAERRVRRADDRCRSHAEGRAARPAGQGRRRRTRPHRQGRSSPASASASASSSPSTARSTTRRARPSRRSRTTSSPTR